MDAMYTDTSLLPPAIPPAPLVSSVTTRAPSLWTALGLIVLYFILQAVGSTLLALILAVTLGFVHLPPGVTQIGNGIDAMLEQPGMQALLVMLTLSVAALSILLLAQRRWPHLWSLAQPPGFGFVRPSRLLYMALAVAIGVAAPLLGAQLTELLAHGQTVSQDIQQLGANTPLAWRIPLVLVVVSLGPMVEELLFRGVLLSTLLQRWGAGWAVVASSLMFALAHLPGLQWQWFGLPDLLLLALLLAWLRLRSGSIWPGVLAHGINNLLAVVAWFVVAHLSG
ncbi:CPBP family intramembrane glutamic endopeptidase [Rhodanobacter sp. C05]|uniref:CPBP family intramembrane glutamic endopeptidase n=1 Tax=Rhodanobacter sp. C05 TaxID=1945855 RepID=UPI000985F147|nr:CPBP family intramembrane glutamic endopeptidase [Rhodanobacter sp. C05]OOG40730.1 abortive infection protein [Rhodanobacter sp. C05]